jgi:hypothetical protein
MPPIVAATLGICDYFRTMPQEYRSIESQKKDLERFPSETVLYDPSPCTNETYSARPTPTPVPRPTPEIIQPAAPDVSPVFFLVSAAGLCGPGVQLGR